MNFIWKKIFFYLKNLPAIVPGSWELFFKHWGLSGNFDSNCTRFLRISLEALCLSGYLADNCTRFLRISSEALRSLWKSCRQLYQILQNFSQVRILHQMVMWPSLSVWRVTYPAKGGYDALYWRPLRPPPCLGWGGGCPPSAVAAGAAV